MIDKFGCEYTLDLSLLLDNRNVVIVDSQEQIDAVLAAAKEQYPSRVGPGWGRQQARLHKGKKVGLSFRGIGGRFVRGIYEQYLENPYVNMISFEDLSSELEIPESDFGFEYIWG